MSEPRAPVEANTGSRRTVHDFKNQLSIILGFSELLLNDMSPDEPRRADVDEIHRAALKALAMVEALAAEAVAPPATR
jgi:signal transduction histidine kinase